MGKSSKSSQPRYDVEGRYVALLESGEAWFSKGYDNAKPQLIAKTAGVSVGLFYRHFDNKQELLTAIMANHLAILHSQIIEEVKKIPHPFETLQAVLVLTLRYFQSHQGLIKLFFMQIGYGDEVATEQLRDARQTYRNILEAILEDGIAQGLFLPPNILDTQIAVNSIIGTINWTIYDLLIVKNQSLEPDELGKKLSDHFLRSLTK